MISGYRGSGKDTMADYLCQKYKFVRFAFADHLKDLCSSLYQISRSDMDDPIKKQLPILSRPVVSKDDFAQQSQMMIFTHFSTQDGRMPMNIEGESYKDFNSRLYYDNESLYYEGSRLYWTIRAILVYEGSVKRTIDPDYWIKKIRDIRDDYIVISDWRYTNEYHEILRCMDDVKVVPVRIDSNSSTDVDPSERGLDQFDGFLARIKNNKNGFKEYYHNIEESIVPLFI